MHITLESDYAVRIVSFLAEKNTRIDAKTIADFTKVSERFTLKILHKLVNAGFVRSYKGAKGGYELSKSPTDITLLEIIETVEGPYYFSRCLGDGYDCSCTDHTICKSRKIFADITESVKNILKNTTFETLLK